jgi:hypothetical protein
LRDCVILSAFPYYFPIARMSCSDTSSNNHAITQTPVPEGLPVRDCVFCQSRNRAKTRQIAQSCSSTCYCMDEKRRICWPKSRKFLPAHLAPPLSGATAILYLVVTHVTNRPRQALPPPHRPRQAPPSSGTGRWDAGPGGRLLPLAGATLAHGTILSPFSRQARRLRRSCSHTTVRPNP